MYEAVVIGVSAGGMSALKEIFFGLPASFPLPVAVVQHVSPDGDSFLAEYLSRHSAMMVKEAEDKEIMVAGTGYLAPAGYHLLIDPGRILSLSVDPPVNYSRPSIDMLFESAAVALGPRLIGVVLTGASGDGSAGLRAIKERGGIAVVQDPATAESPYMPRAAIEAAAVDYVVELAQIAPLLLRLSGENNAG